VQALHEAKCTGSTVAAGFVKRIAAHLRKSFVIRDLDRSLQQLLPLVDQAVTDGRSARYNYINGIIKEASLAWTKTPVETSAFCAEVRKALREQSATEAGRDIQQVALLHKFASTKHTWTAQPSIAMLERFLNV